MREMKDSGIEWIGEIPNEWRIGVIKNAYSIILGKMLSPIQTHNEQTLENYLCAANIKWSGIDTSIQKKMWFSRSEKQTYILQNNDVVIMEGGLAGTTCLYKGELAPCYIQNSVHCCRAKHNFANRFLYYWMSVVYNSGYVDNLCNKATIQHYTKEKVMNTPFVIIPFSNQKRIADYLDRKCSQIDAIIARQQEIIEKLKAYKLSVITEAVTKGLNPDVRMKDSGVEWIGKIPENWSESTILRNIRFEGGSQPSLEHFIDEPREGYIRLIQNRDYRTNDYATYVPITMVSKFCTKEDVMIGRYGPPIFVIHRGLEGAYNVALMKAVPINIDREFMFFYLQNSTLLKYIESFSVRTAGQSGVNPNILKRYPMFIPPVEEQKQIAKCLLQKCHHIENLIANKKKMVEKLMSYKKSLIYEVVTGKKEV